MSVVENCNRKFEGRAYLLCSGKRTHMMDAELTLQMLDCVVTPVPRPFCVARYIHKCVECVRLCSVCCQALRLQRARLGLSAGQRAMILTDGFTGNAATKHGEGARRARWSESVNCGFCPTPPGGWSAHGQPCDAVHANYRPLMDAYEDICLGFDTNPLKRARIEYLLRDEGGFSPRSICHESVVDGAVWAWEAHRTWHMPSGAHTQ